MYVCIRACTYVCIYHLFIEREIYYMELAHEIMEAGKSQDLQLSQQAGDPAESICSASLNAKAWEPREPMVWSQSEGWQTQGLGIANVSVWVWMQEQANILAQRLLRIHFYLEEGQLFCTIQVFRGLEEAHPR